jgi:hypothetical protein
VLENSDASSVIAAITALVAVDVTHSDEVQLAAACRTARRVRAWLDAFDAAAARRSEQLKATGHGRGAETMLTRNGRVTARQARQTIRRAEALGAAPALAAALEAGALSAGHVDAFAAAARRAGPNGRAALADRQRGLAALAATESPEEFAVACRRVAVLADDEGGVGEADRQRRATRLHRWHDEATGMYRLAGAFDPELGVRIWRAIDHAVAANYPAHQRPDTTPDGPDAGDHLAALALADLITAAFTDQTGSTPPAEAAPTPSSGTPPSPSSTASALFRRPPRGEFTVVIDYETLLAGLRDASIVEVDPGGVPLPVATLRRLACEAGLLPAVLSSDGVVLDVGRAKRLATADQRRALRVMYPHCAIDDCQTIFDHCDVHHLDPFHADDRNGETNLNRLLPLCHRHHHAAHEGHWQLHLHPTTRLLTVTLPDGTTHTHPPPRAKPAA